MTRVGRGPRVLFKLLEGLVYGAGSLRLTDRGSSIGHSGSAPTPPKALNRAI